MNYENFTELCSIWIQFVKDALLPEDAWSALDEYDYGIRDRRSGDFRLIALILNKRVHLNDRKDFSYVFFKNIKDAFKNYKEDNPDRMKWLEDQTSSLEDIHGKGNGNYHNIKKNEYDKIVASMKTMIDSYNLNEEIKRKYSDSFYSVYNKKEIDLQNKVDALTKQLEDERKKFDTWGGDSSQLKAENERLKKELEVEKSKNKSENSECVTGKCDLNSGKVNKEYFIGGNACSAKKFADSLRNRYCTVHVTKFYQDGSKQYYDWNVSKFWLGSSLSSNIHSNPNILRDWKKNGIIGVRFDVDE